MFSREHSFLFVPSLIDSAAFIITLPCFHSHLSSRFSATKPGSAILSKPNPSAS